MGALTLKIVMSYDGSTFEYVRMIDLGLWVVEEKNKRKIVSFLMWQNK